MTIRETAIAKIQQLPDSLVQQIIDFIDFIARNHPGKTAIDSFEGDRSEAWARWFEATDGSCLSGGAHRSEVLGGQAT